MRFTYLKEHDGRFTMTKHETIPDKNAGFEWLKKRGFTVANIVKMDYTEYAYKNGTIGLYIIDDLLYSVILYFPEGSHEAIEKELGLDTVEIISIPYNKLLRQMRKLRSIQI